MFMDTLSLTLNECCQLCVLAEAVWYGAFQDGMARRFSELNPSWSWFDDGHDGAINVADMRSGQSLYREKRYQCGGGQ